MVDHGSSYFPPPSSPPAVEAPISEGPDTHEEVGQEAMRAAPEIPSAKWSWAKHVGVPAILSLCALVGVGYWHSSRSPSKSAAGATSAAVSSAMPAPLVRPYPRGRWRIAPRAELYRVVLFVSHILIRHRDAEASTPSFGPTGWSIQPPPPARTAAEAARLAEDLAVRARQEPGRFAELARTFSEDITTRDRGGSFGGVSAGRFIGDTSVLDALAGMKPGDVSRPVETRYGFHIFQLQPVPELAEISARRIVIGHDSTDWLQLRLRAGMKPHRTREQALALAGELAERARATPGLFRRLVATYSEHRDAVDEGDIGVWSTREAGNCPRVLDTIAQLQIGQVSDPIETPLGVEIFERTPVEPRASLAAAQIRLRFNPEAGQDDSASKTKIAALAKSILETLSKDPDRFASFQEQYCCAQHERFTVGRGDSEKTSVLSALPIGGIAHRLVEFDNGYSILKRLDPKDEPPELPLTFELPNPSRPDLEQLITNAAPRALASRTRDMARSSATALNLAGEKKVEFEALHDRLAKEFETLPSDERLQAFRRFEGELEQLLDRGKVEQYRALVDASVVRMTMIAN